MINHPTLISRTEHYKNNNDNGLDAAVPLNVNRMQKLHLTAAVPYLHCHSCEGLHALHPTPAQPPLTECSATHESRGAGASALCIPRTVGNQDKPYLWVLRHGSYYNFDIHPA